MINPNSEHHQTQNQNQGQGQGQSSKDPIPRKHRKLNRSQHQLKRNAACLPCRRRRIKCDASKPICGSCVRSFQFLQRTNPDQGRDQRGIQCFYEHEHDHEGEEESDYIEPRVGMGQRVEDPRNTVRKLEARVGMSHVSLIHSFLLDSERERGGARDEGRCELMERGITESPWDRSS
ncbi:MAG: Zn(II)2Cys6 transcription factor, partial [Sphingobacteriales bacterium]